ncbi:MAG: hypothetical protein EOO55_00560 [Hymenobacter sp.]|nr:MAG: hypothetical protein EOO55_00560 [Hymenobacter sp.]
MLCHSLLFTALLGFAVSAAQAQSQPKPDHFPRYPASALQRPSFAQPSSSLLGPLPAAPGPTVRAAALYAPLPRPASLLTPDSMFPSPPRHDLTGVLAAPPYDLYQNLPEEFRKRTLPIPWVEPLPLQLLRGVLGR